MRRQRLPHSLHTAHFTRSGPAATRFWSMNRGRRSSRWPAEIQGTRGCGPCRLWPLPRRSLARFDQETVTPLL